MDRSRWAAWAKKGVKLAVTVVVLAFVGRHIAGTWRDLHAEGRSIRIDPRWAALSVALYVPGLALCGAFYGRVLRGVKPGVDALPAIRAYLISHLGKYVPGKAMVVVMRVGLTTPFGARPASATFATFYETLVMMAAGGLVAAAGLMGSKPLKVAEYRPVSVPPAWIGLALGLGFLIVVSPPVFPKLTALAKRPFRGLAPDVLPRTSWPLLAEGLAWTVGAWLLMGASQIAILNAIMPAGIPVPLWPAVVGAVALATVAGFVIAVAPAGLGVRELVLWTVLGSAIDRDLAVVAALMLRLAWLAAEVLAALVLAPVRPKPSGVGA